MVFVRFLQRLFQHRATIRSLVVRDIRSRYTGSFLGLFWSVAHPLLQLLIYYFVFSTLLRVRLGPEYGGTSFSVWLIVGLLPWMLFSEVVGRSPNAVLEQAGLIKRTVFPSEVIPFAHVLAASLNHLITLILVVAVIWIFGHAPSAVTLLFIPYFLAVTLFALGLSWILSSLNVFLRDVGQLVGIVLQIWFYLTPVIYPTNVIPERFRAWMSLNPMLHAIDAYRMALLVKLVPNPRGLAYAFAVGAFTFILGGLLFRRLKPSFVDVL